MLTSHKNAKNVKKEKVLHNIKGIHIILGYLLPLFFLFVHYFVLSANLQIRISVES